MKYFSSKKRIAPIGAALAVTAGLFCPLIAHADTFNYTLTLSADTGYTMQVLGTSDIQVTSEAGNTMLVLEDGDHNHLGTASCTTNDSCTITVTNGPAGSLNYNTTNFSIFNGTNQYDHGDISTNTTLTIKDYVDDSNTGGAFDGKAYLFWSCGKSDLCYHYFNDINTENQTTYYAASTVEADNHDGIFFNPATATFQNAGFALKTDWEGFIADHATYGLSDVMGEDKIDLNPVNSPVGKHSFTHFADRNFKVCIYDNQYNGLIIGNWSGLTYKPSFWAGLFAPEEIEMSGSTKSNPALLETVLVEPSIVIKSGNHGAPIKSVERTRDYADGVVTISSLGDGVFKIEFDATKGGNYYDHEIFKITDMNDNVYYVRIARIAVTGEIPMYPGISNYDLEATVYYPTSDYSCNDFIVTAKIIYDNKAPKTVTLDSAEEFIAFNGDPVNGCEMVDNPDDGGNLTQGHYTYHIGNSVAGIKGVYFNVSRRTTGSNTFGGMFSGSGQGTYLDLNKRTIDWSK